MRFPTVLTVPGRPPPPNPKKDRKGDPVPCRDCGALYEHHSGDLCAICRRPMEHHDDGELDQEIEACARLSLARRHAGHPLRPHETWCISQTEQKAAA